MSTGELKNKVMSIDKELHGIETPESDQELDELADDEFDDDDDEDALEELLEQVIEWAAEWSDTTAFATLSDEQRAESEAVICHFSQYMYTHYDKLPVEWNVRDMEDCCVETLPRKVTAEEVYFRSVAPVLGSFFRFLGRTGKLRSAGKLADRATQLNHRIVSASQNPANWGMAKSMMMSAQAAGVDVSDPDAINAFFETYNERLIAPAAGLPLPLATELMYPEDDFEPEDMPYERPGPKVGRNDPCPCGSGKKHKKCCGTA